ncbi:MAG TPA: hypothetical protein VLB11_05480, partial [Methyloceanibacter sp.]|nr:hypothetical protein [Methyloceanibacter sp.]
ATAAIRSFDPAMSASAAAIGSSALLAPVKMVLPQTEARAGSTTLAGVSQRAGITGASSPSKRRTSNATPNTLRRNS